MDVQRYIDRFESESREIFAERPAITELLRLEPGEAIADIGSGTGIFVELFADAVGPDGQVYAVEISPKFVEHLDGLARALGVSDRVQTVLCKEDSVELPAASIDVAFVCDTYHHFEYPRSTLGSIRRALRPGGRLVVIDFHRIEGESKEWILEHVRAGQEVFAAEIEQAGFVRAEDPPAPFLEENYVMEFVREPGS